VYKYGYEYKYLKENGINLQVSEENGTKGNTDKTNDTKRNQNWQQINYIIICNK
jgi:hypothetical protein